MHIEGELLVADSTVWYNVMQKKDYAVALNVTGVGVDDPDANFVENFYLQVRAQLHQLLQPGGRQADRRAVEGTGSRQAQGDRLGDREEAGRGCGAARALTTRKNGTCWYPHVKGVIRHDNSIYNQWRFEDVWLDK